MGRIRLIIRLALAVLVAVVGRTFHRIFRGPVVPTWSWSVEMTVVALRAFIMASAVGGDRAERRALEASFNPRLPRSLRDLVAVRPGSVGSIRGEWHERGGHLDDRATILYLHGGAYLSGNPATHRRFVARLTWETHTRSFVADYRIAPAHPFPAAVDDALSAYLGLLEEGIEPGKIILAGDSAGGGLATALLLRLRDEHHPLPAGSILFSPYTDLEHQSESLRRNWQTDYLPLGDARPNLEYIGTADPRNPYVSPRYGDFTGIAPMLIFAGGREMILDDSLNLAEAAKRDGADVDLILEPDMFHVWPALIPGHPATARAMAKSAEFVVERAVSPGS
ncbi:MAG: alpha/beta hydrolase [Acidimicrobiia bacterium]|nr:alpha/beta hydrolase [Acidimicrobiia bacterium]